MIVLILVIVFFILTALALYSTNNIYSILISILLISGMGYMIKYRY